MRDADLRSVMHADHARVERIAPPITAQLHHLSLVYKLSRKTLYTEKTPLPEGRYYIKDLIGLEVYENDEKLGVLTDVFNTGANDIYEVKTNDGKNIYLPVIDGVIGDVDLENKKIFVTIPDGLLDD